MNTSTRFRRNDVGAASVEYALVAALISVVMIGSVILFGGASTGLFQKTCESLPYKSSSC